MGLSIGIIAVDPTSPYTGGPSLGPDTYAGAFVRAGIYIRSMATRGSLGAWRGLPPMSLHPGRFRSRLDHDRNRSVGQDEVDIVRLANIYGCNSGPRMGDDVQSIKAASWKLRHFCYQQERPRGAERVER